MTLLSPWSLLWLGSIPVLVWLWRLASTHRRTTIPSLIPFEHLLKRSSLRRRRLVTNLLFWLQLAALSLLTPALARPAVVQRQGDLILAVLDTSASMGAREGGSSVFEQAKQALLSRLAARPSKDRIFVVTSAPVKPLFIQPTSDRAALTQAVRELSVSDLGGNLATTVRLGRSFLHQEPNRTLIVTDEPRPREPPGAGIEWMTVGRPLANLALVGLEAQGPLCSPSDARLIATVQNFSTAASRADLAVVHGSRRLASTTVDLAPNARMAVSLVLPEMISGLVEITLSARADHLGTDNRAWLELRRTAAMPVLVRLHDPAARSAVSTWLAACPALPSAALDGSTAGPHLLITDELGGRSPAPAATMVFHPSSDARPTLSYWIASSSHPIGSYLAPVEIVAARLNHTEATASSGIPVVSGIVRGRKIPIVVADEQSGQRVVRMFFDPSSTVHSTPALLAFFNSLRWLMGSSATLTTGEPFHVGGFASGAVSIRRPDGSTETVEAPGGSLQYDGTTLAGRYRCSQGARVIEAAVNFFNPLESNLLERPSTWRELPTGPVAAASSPGRTMTPLAHLLIWLLLVLVVVEWWLYSLKGESLRVRVSGFGATAPPQDRFTQSPEPRAQSVGAR